MKPLESLFALLAGASARSLSRASSTSARTAGRSKGAHGSCCRFLRLLISPKAPAYCGAPFPRIGPRLAAARRHRQPLDEVRPADSRASSPRRR